MTRCLGRKRVFCSSYLEVTPMDCALTGASQHHNAHGQCPNLAVISPHCYVIPVAVLSRYPASLFGTYQQEQCTKDHITVEGYIFDLSDRRCNVLLYIFVVRYIVPSLLLCLTS
jgi:hypothetical protein